MCKTRARIFCMVLLSDRISTSMVNSCTARAIDPFFSLSLVLLLELIFHFPSFKWKFVCILVHVYDSTLNQYIGRWKSNAIEWMKKRERKILCRVMVIDYMISRNCCCLVCYKNCASNEREKIATSSQWLVLYAISMSERETAKKSTKQKRKTIDYQIIIYSSKMMKYRIGWKQRAPTIGNAKFIMCIWK